MYFGAHPKHGLIGMVAAGRASSSKCHGHCLSAQLQCAVPVTLYAGMAASRREDSIGTEWKVEHWYEVAVVLSNLQGGK